MSHPTERCELTNLCMITDAENRILVQDRTDPSWPGICFPGGHVEPGESFVASVIREYKTEEGSLRTMPGIKNLIRYQQNLAADSGVAFWNMFEAMGGEGSMADMVHAKPSLANYDYTHINFRGGKHLAEVLYEALVYGKEQYDRRRAYEKE